MAQNRIVESEQESGRTLKQPNRTFRARIFRSILWAYLPVVLLLSIAVELFYVPSLTSHAKLDLTNSTHALTNAIQASASVAIRNHLKAIAERNREIVRQHLSYVDQGMLTKEEALKRTRSILLSQRIGSSGYIYCLNSKGRMVVHPNPKVQGSNFSSVDFFQKQLARKEGYLEYDWQNPGEPEPRPKALYMVYLKELEWIISVSSYRSEFSELLNPGDLRDMVLSLQFGKSGYAYVLEKDGGVLIHPKLSEFNILQHGTENSDLCRKILSGGPGIVEYEWRNPDENVKRRKIAIYESIPNYNWVVASSAYLDEIMRPAKLARIVTHGSALLLLLTGGLASFYLSGRLTRPVIKMLRQLDMNSTNADYVRLPIPADDELGQLAREFNAFLDMTERQNNEIKSERERYRSLYEASPDAILLMMGVSIIDCNESTLSLLRTNRLSIIGKNFLDYSPPEQKDGEPSALLGEKLVKNALIKELQTFEWKTQTSDGRLFDSEVRLKRLGDEEGKPLLLAFVRDITERKKSEHALRESELKYRQLVETANDSIFIAQGQKVIFANARSSEISGYEINEILGRPFQAFIHPDDLQTVLDRFARRTGGERELPSTYSFRLITKQNTEKIVQISVAIIEWNGKPATLNCMRDITEQKRMEDALQQAQKMKSLGTLAGGIAHDFNNLLMGIQGRASLMAMDLPPSHSLLEHVQAIDEYIRSASGLTRQLLGAARGGKYEPKPIDVNEVVNASSAMFSRTRKEIQVEKQPSPDPIVVEADRQQIEQVLLNMYVNAWQAMPEGGTILLETDVTTLDENLCKLHNAMPGRYATISVKDNGMGIDGNDIKHVFDPFFTTKEKSRGTGLGLASAYGIVKNHDGFITVNSEVGIGTTFTVHLPVSDKKVYHEHPTVQEMRKGTETILLVDDETMVIDVTTELLKSMGYTVIAANGGEQAISELSETGDSIDLVILDMIMPGMDGSAAFDRIRDVRPNIPVILSSGYARDGKAEEIMKRGCNGFIQKPYTISKLSDKIRKVLDG